MAKALYGHTGGLDPRLVAEVTSLRARVRELEAEVERLRADRMPELPLDDAGLDSGLRALAESQREPVLT
jgi:hypothetical protein